MKREAHQKKFQNFLKKIPQKVYFRIVQLLIVLVYSPFLPFDIDDQLIDTCQRQRSNPVVVKQLTLEFCKHTVDLIYFTFEVNSSLRKYYKGPILSKFFCVAVRESFWTAVLINFTFGMNLTGSIFPHGAVSSERWGSEKPVGCKLYIRSLPYWINLFTWRSQRWALGEGKHVGCSGEACI